VARVTSLRFREPEAGKRQKPCAVTFKDGYKFRARFVARLG
jgi:hypothetical protein